MSPTPSTNISNSALPEHRQGQLQGRILSSALAAALLMLLSACSGGDQEVAAEPEPGTLKSAASESHQANTAAIGALQRAQAAEQAQLQQAEQRRREMEAQGI